MADPSKRPTAALPPDASRPFRDPALVARLVEAIRRDAEAAGRPITLMEVCGTHTVAVSRFGLRDLLDGLVELRSGPGCPVCVTAQADIDRMIALAALPDVTVVTYGDMVRVPGTLGTLETARAAGADVRIVYSALDALTLVQPGREFVFLGVGFETTAPGVCLALAEARRLGIGNFTILSAHKTIPAALAALLRGAKPPDDGAPPRQAPPGPRAPRVQGFILPGHVSAVIGRGAYDFLASDFGLPGAITGFEPVDILVAIRELVRSIVHGADPKVVNLYPRVVREEGNAKAREAVARVFEPRAVEWRGLGVIPDSGLGFRAGWTAYDAEARFGPSAAEVLARTPRAAGPGPQAACQCGAVLRGEVLPTECRLFARACTPAEPVGPCMVASEGSCGAYYRYERRRWAR